LRTAKLAEWVRAPGPRLGGLVKRRCFVRPVRRLGRKKGASVFEHDERRSGQRDDARIRILIADDHPILRDGVSAVIEMQPDMVIAGEAASGPEAVAAFADLRPDITLMDLQMPGGGVQAIEAIRKAHADAKIIVLTTFAGNEKAMDALRAGAAGYMLKSSLRHDLLDAIRAVHAGRRHLHPEVAADIAIHAVDEPLNAREVAILRLIANGNSNKHIARELSLSEDTIKSNVKSLFAKLGVNDRTHAVTIAARRGIIDL
jgi:DNA-binding NarL/FixJ family response regulator